MGLVHTMVDAGREIRDSLQNLGYTAESFFLHHVGDKVWMSIDGRFDVFEWRNGLWVNLYKGKFHGYNFGSDKFTSDGKLFSFKGYGFWRDHGDIIEFLPEKGEWEIIPESKKIPFGIGYMIDSSFFIHSNTCYKVNLKEQKVQKTSCSYKMREQVTLGREYIFDDYVLVATRLDDGAQFPIIEKSTGTVYISYRQPFKGFRDPRIVNSIYHIKGNQLKILFPDSSSITYNVEDELNKYYLKASDETWTGLSWYWWIIFGLSGLFISSQLLRYFRKPATPRDLTRLLPFKDYSGRLINSDELDKILGIDEIRVYETRKFKRASLIHELNSLSIHQYGQKIIQRERNPDDKRFYLYRILYVEKS